jgi:peroxiredoxin
MIRKTRLIVTACFVCVVVCGATFGQATQPSEPGRGGRGGRDAGAMVERVREILQELSPTQEQKAQIETIVNEAREQARQLMEEVRDLAPPERAAKVREFVASVHERVAGVLDEEQRLALEQRLQEMRQRFGGQGGPGQGGILRRLSDAAEQLGLSDEQRGKLEESIAQARERIRAAREETQGDARQFAAKAREIGQEVVEELSQGLSPEQQQKLRDLMSRDDNRGRDRDDRTRRRDQRNAAPAEPKMDAPSPATQPATQPSDERRAQAPAPSDIRDRPGGQATNLAVGVTAPDFALQKLDGLPVQLSSFSDRPLLLIFGSYSSPSFRQRARGLNELRKQFSARVNFLIIYTREAHAAGAWEIERNRDEQITVAEHADVDARRAAAKLARERLGLTDFRLATDTMDDAVASAYGAWPNNAAVLVGRDGAILAYQKWFDPQAMKAVIERNVRK